LARLICSPELIYAYSNKHRQENIGLLLEGFNLGFDGVDIIMQLLETYERKQRVPYASG